MWPHVAALSISFSFFLRLLRHFDHVPIAQPEISARIIGCTFGEIEHEFWAWAVFNRDGTFDAELTGCSHLADSHAPGLQGAQHFHADGHYIVAPFNGALWIVVVDEADTASGGFLGTGTVMTVPSEFMPIGPAAKAKLSTVDFFGMTAPGVSFQVTVTPMHT